MWPNTRRDQIHKATVFVFLFFLIAQSLISWNTTKRAQFGPVHIYVSEQDAEVGFTELKPASMHRRMSANNRTGLDKSNAILSLDANMIISQKALVGSDSPWDNHKSEWKAHGTLSKRPEDLKIITNGTFQNISKDHRGRKIKLDENTKFAIEHGGMTTPRRPTVSKPSSLLGRATEWRAIVAGDREGNKHFPRPGVATTFSTMKISRNSSKAVNRTWLGFWLGSEESMPTNISSQTPKFSAKKVEQLIAKESLSREKIVELDERLRETLQATRMHCPLTPPNLGEYKHKLT